MRAKLLSLIGVTCLVFSGCGTGSEGTSNQGETHTDIETVTEDETENLVNANTETETDSTAEANTESVTDTESTVIALKDYSLTGSDLEMNGTGTDDSENAYVVYTDSSYEYYFYSDDMTLHMILSTKTDMTASDADTDYLIEQATSYIRQINALDDFTDDDWVVYESAEGLYDLSLTQTVYGETLSVASFTFSGDELLDVVLNTHEANGT